MNLYQYVQGLLCQARSVKRSAEGNREWFKTAIPDGVRYLYVRTGPGLKVTFPKNENVLRYVLGERVINIKKILRF